MILSLGRELTLTARFFPRCSERCLGKVSISAALHSFNKLVHLPMAAHSHSFRLIKLAVVTPINPGCVAVFKGFNGQIESPRLAINTDVGKRIEGGVHPYIIHNVIGKILFHIGRVALHVVDNKFVESQPGLPGNVMIKLDLKAIPVAGIILRDHA